MKTNVRIQKFVNDVCFLRAFHVIPCDNRDDGTPVPVKTDDVNGIYSANKNVITFDELPVKEIVRSVVKDAAKAEAALKTIEKVKFPVDGATKNVVVTFSSPQKGVYKSKTLKFDLTADKITSDGAAVAPYTAVKYSFPNFLKK
ncbi:hypothetical protein FQR65_LT20643 [Abscondita terminalis]|nr:hypothetical protein FQR65_LT20643 [Abscondita terminalis]